MAIYVLGTQCLFDIAKKDGNKAHQWYELQERQGVLFGDIRISAFSVAQLKFFFDKFPPATVGDRQLKINVNLLIDQFKQADAVIGCSPETAYYWAENLGEVVVYDLPSPHPVGTEALVIATVAVGHEDTQCTLVDLLQPIHLQLGISVHDPY